MNSEFGDLSPVSMVHIRGMVLTLFPCLPPSCRGTHINSNPKELLDIIAE